MADSGVAARPRGAGAGARGPHGVALMLFVLVWLSCVWFGSYAFNPNNATRLFAAISLVERGDAKIDRYQSLTIDKAQFGKGAMRHYYMDKAPGMTLIAVPAVWAANAATGKQSLDEVIDIANPRLRTFLGVRLSLAVAYSSAVLTAFAAVLLLDLGTGLTGSPAAGVFAALGYALGSVVWGWSTTLFGHAPVAALFLIATWAIWRGTAGARELRRWRYPVMAGLALGFAVAIEFQAALAGVAIGVWALWRTRGVTRPIRLRMYAVAAVMAGVAVLPVLAYDQVAFGTPFVLGYQGVVGFKGMNEGLFGLTYPKPFVFWEILFGLRRGLLWVAPVLVLGAVGLGLMVRDRTTRDLGCLAIAVIAIVLSINASYYYWDGGASVGPRHSVPAIPFLAIGLAPSWAALRRQALRWAAVALLGVSIVINLIITSTDMFASEALASPVWTSNFEAMFLRGTLATVLNRYGGWGAWFSFALYLDIALPLLALIVWQTRRAERIALE
ncbi:hypothetical protein [Sphingomonas sp. TREG-RG-20F-R18-01]|uniref:hypothetical protein n=1 Tax=Sphingomonas sp. TREG-RG-20F-R18-01 TaxID=2914982 RepID=UPI001F562BFC|nr:hypothetical protein [Sphingomonas sp. TREG-RG-20F-R18-01]